jgi:hypothetical protein
VQVGDEVEVDNSMFLAAQTYHRHQVPGPDFPVWQQFLQEDGSPVYPQRPFLLGPLMALGASGTVQTGRFEGRMIMVASLLDREAYPWQADWYRRKVQEHLGDGADDRYRLWYVDNALHGDDEAQDDPTHTVSYLGVLHEALRQLAAWVEQGREPARTTSYRVVDGQVEVPPSATERGSVQPVVTLTVDGGEAVVVPAGEEVELRAVAEVPDSVGRVVSLEWDLDGSGAFATSEVIEPGEQVVVERRHIFDEPGTFFVTARAISQSEAVEGTLFGRLVNLARIRVVVP